MELYISSYDYASVFAPRRVLHYQKTKIDNRNCLIVEVDEPVIGQQHGLLDRDINTLFLINRHDEYAFDKLNKFPIHVHVCIVKSIEIREEHVTALSDLQQIIWACLYNNETDARIIE